MLVLFVLPGTDKVIVVPAWDVPVLRNSIAAFLRLPVPLSVSAVRASIVLVAMTDVPGINSRVVLDSLTPSKWAMLAFVFARFVASNLSMLSRAKKSISMELSSPSDDPPGFSSVVGNMSDAYQSSHRRP